MNETVLRFHPRVGDQLARREDDRRHVPYEYTDEIIIAVNAALATERPLLLRGTPGSGKSTLARDIAIALDLEFDEKVITSRTSAADLLWTFDAVRRLSDTHPDPDRARDPSNYVERGVLWNAFKPEPLSSRGIVVLLDEIDKADPDVPNDLLVPLDERRFEVSDARPKITVEQTREVFVVITTNGERELPPAFLRRCAALTLEDPSRNPVRLQAIAQRHLTAMFAAPQARPDFDTELLSAIVKRIDELAPKVETATYRRAGTAEILDAFKACLKLGFKVGTSEWNALTAMLLSKDPRTTEPEKAPGP